MCAVPCEAVCVCVCVCDAHAMACHVLCTVRARARPLGQIKEDTTTVDAMYGLITGLAWTDDGQILTVATQSGTLLNYLAKIPNIVDPCGMRVAYLSSLREMSVADTSGDTPPLVLPVSVEPSFVALGPLHVAVRDWVPITGWG